MYFTNLFKAAKLLYKCISPILVCYSLFMYMAWLSTYTNIMLQLWSFYIFSESIVLLNMYYLNIKPQLKMYLIQIIIAYFIFIMYYGLRLDLTTAISLLVLIIAYLNLLINLIRVLY